MGSVSLGLCEGLEFALLVSAVQC